MKVFLLGGQSNMNGLGESSFLIGDLASPLPAVQIWTSTSFNDLSSGFGDDYGPELQFGHALADAFPGEDIVLIKYAASGTDLENDWDPATGPQYASFKNRVNAALAGLDSNNIDYNIEAMLWTQGERDARQGYGPAYESNLNAFIADVRSEFGNDLPFLFSQLSSGQTNLPASGLSQVRAAQVNVAAGDTDAYLINTDSFSLKTDDLHFDSAGQLSLGQAFAEQYLAIAPEPSSLSIIAIGAICVLRRRQA